MDIAAYPFRRFVGKTRPQLNREVGRGIGLDFDLPLFKTKFESAHDSDLNCSRRHGHFRRPDRVKVMRFKRPLGSSKAVVGVHPRIVRCIGPPIRPGDEDPRGKRLSVRIDHAQRQPSRRLLKFPLASHQLGLRSARDPLNPQRSISIAIRDERNLRPIRRPPRIRVVEVPVRNRKGIPTRGRHHPKLMPLPSQIGRVHHPRPVRRKVRARPPRGLFIMNFARLGARVRLDPPESAGPVNVSAIRNEQNLRPIA